MKEGSSFAASLLVGRKSPHSRLLPNGFWNAHTHSLTQAERDRQAGIFRSVLPHTQEPNPTNPSKFFFCQSSSKTVRTIEAGHHTDGNEGGGLAGSAARKKTLTTAGAATRHRFRSTSTHTDARRHSRRDGQHCSARLWPISDDLAK